MMISLSIPGKGTSWTSLMIAAIVFFSLKHGIMIESFVIVILKISPKALPPGREELFHYKAHTLLGLCGLGAPGFLLTLISFEPNHEHFRPYRIKYFPGQ